MVRRAALDRQRLTRLGRDAEFQYFFAQREALETIVYLCDVVGVKDKYDLMRFDSSGAVSAGCSTKPGGGSS